MYVEGLSWGGWQRQASLSTLFRFQVWTCVKCSTVFSSRRKADPPLVKSYQTCPATETFFTAGGRVWTVTAVVGVECFLLVFLTFKGLFFSSLIAGLFSQWERKGSFSGVSDITQLTNPLWDLDMMPKVGFFSPPHCSPAEEGIHLRRWSWDQQSRMTDQRRPSNSEVDFRDERCTLDPPPSPHDTLNLTPFPTYHHPACSCLTVRLKGSIASTHKNVFVCTKNVLPIVEQ